MDEHGMNEHKRTGDEATGDGGEEGRRERDARFAAVRARLEASLPPEMRPIDEARWSSILPLLLLAEGIGPDTLDAWIGDLVRANDLRSRRIAELREAAEAAQTDAAAGERMDEQMDERPGEHPGRGPGEAPWN